MEERDVAQGSEKRGGVRVKTGAPWFLKRTPRALSRARRINPPAAAAARGRVAACAAGVIPCDETDPSSSSLDLSSGGGFRPSFRSRSARTFGGLFLLDRSRRVSFRSIVRRISFRDDASQSKLAMNLFARELERRGFGATAAAPPASAASSDSGGGAPPPPASTASAAAPSTSTSMRALSVNPGAVDSDIWRHVRPAFVKVRDTAEGDKYEMRLICPLGPSGSGI